MEGERDSRDPLPAGPGQDGQHAALALAFRRALEAAELRRARELLAQAARDGLTPGPLYVDVVRPALVALPPPGDGLRPRPAAGIRDAVLAELVARLPLASRAGAGRAAVLSCAQDGIEALDGSVAMDFLEGDGWAVERVHDRRSDDRLDCVAQRGAIELAVAITAGPEDAGRLASVCTRLRRLADPPVILLCDFSGRSRPGAACAALGADAVAHDPEQLVRCAAQRTPEDGRRRWGVRLSRAPGSLMLAPTGRLDATSAGRLSDVALSRLGTYSELTVDLRDLAEIEAAGVRELAGWATLPALDAVQLRVVSDARVQARLRACGIELGWTPSGAGSATLV